MEKGDRAAGEVLLWTSKNGHGRVLPLAGELAALIERRRSMREHRKAGLSHGSKYVFHHQGEPAMHFRNAWARACKTAKVPSRLFHDLRRTAVRAVFL